MEDQQHQAASQATTSPTPGPKPRLSTSAAIASGVALTALLAGGGTGLWAWNKLTSSTPPDSPPLEQVESPPAQESPLSQDTAPAPEADTPDSQAPAATAPAAPQAPLPAASAPQPQTYWLRASGESLDLIPAAVELNAKAETDPAAALELALERLLAGPRDQEHATAIPEGTRLRRLSVRQDGVHIDLSQDFTTGGGTFSMTGRIAQVLHTATSINPEAPVWLEVDGEPLEVLGGEGLILDRPLTRRGFANDFAL